MEEEKRKIRVLNITPGLNLCGGIESYVMNYYRNMSDRVIVDFITHDIKEEQYKNEIEKKGGKVFLMESIGLKNIFKAIKNIKSFFENHNDYDIVHCHMANAAPFYFYYARKNGIDIRILHSHQTNYADKFTHKLRNIPLIGIGKKLANVNFACSKLAGDFLYGNHEYTVINNAIDIEKFKFNQENREKIRSLEGISDDTILLGNIGRFCNQKNQLFLLDIFKDIHEKNNNTKLILIGAGDLKNKIEQKVESYKLNDAVIIKNPINNVNEYLQAIDALIMPSLYEGLPVIGIEAQAAGCICFFSDTITKETKVTENSYFIKLDEKPEKWSNEILHILEKEHRKDESDMVEKNGFNIKKEGIELERKYMKLCLEKGIVQDGENKKKN